MAAALLLTSVGSICAGHEETAPTNPPGKVPAGVLLVKGAWWSASDSVTPLPESGRVSTREYSSPYFHLSYPIASGWTQQYEGPPPSDSGYYVLAQLQSPQNAADASRGTVMIAAQDMFFSIAPARNAMELVKYTGDHLGADYTVDHAPTQVSIAGHSFVRLDYSAPVTNLHWTTLATQIRCHTVQFIYMGTDPQLIERLVGGLNAMKLPAEAGLSAGTGGGGAPVCIPDYASGDHVLSRTDPILTDRRYNSIPVRVVIDVHGHIKHIHFISSFPDQARALTDALRQWRFKPYVVNGKAVEVETGILFGMPLRRPSPSQNGSSGVKAQSLSGRIQAPAG